MYSLNVLNVPMSLSHLSFRVFNDGVSIDTLKLMLELGEKETIKNPS